MASINYDSFLDDVFNNNIDLAADTFYMMLVTSSYVPNQGTHTKRSQVTNEVSGTGYVAGGAAVTVAISKDTSAHTNKLTWSSPSWASSTITAAGGVIYKHRGGASSADELVQFCDFGGNIVSTNGTFSASETAPQTFQN